MIRYLGIRKWVGCGSARHVGWWCCYIIVKRRSTYGTDAMNEWRKRVHGKEQHLLHAGEASSSRREPEKQRAIYVDTHSLRCCSIVIGQETCCRSVFRPQSIRDILYLLRVPSYHTFIPLGCIDVGAVHRYLPECGWWCALVKSCIDCKTPVPLDRPRMTQSQRKQQRPLSKDETVTRRLIRTPRVVVLSQPETLPCGEPARASYSFRYHCLHAEPLLSYGAVIRLA